MTQKKSSSDKLAHYGVKGMHWGVRKSNPTNSNYSQYHQNQDRSKYGKAGVKRINRRMNKGMDHQTARKKEASFRLKRRLAIVGALAVHDLTKVYGPVLAQNISVRAETNRGRAAVSEALGLPSKGSSGPVYSQKKRGAYNITNA